jgi:hypothetical protein
MITGIARWAIFGLGLSGAIEARADLAKVFDLDGRYILQEEEHLGVANGRLTVGINYRDVAGVSGLWAPPFVSSNFMLDGRVDGRKVPTVTWTWRPFQVERGGLIDDVAVSTATTMIYHHRAMVVSFTFRNRGRVARPVEFFVLGCLDSVRDWGFPRPGSSSQTSVRVEGRGVVLRQGNLAIVVAMDAAEWLWEVSGNLGHAFASLPAGKARTVNVVITIGSGDEAKVTADKLLEDPADAVRVANAEYVRQVGEVFEKLPTLESDNARLVRWYNRSLVHFLMNRWDVPEFLLHPYYATGSVKGGCLGNYLWNFGETWEILPLFDALATKAHIRQFLKCDLLKHFLFYPITGEADGPWYMVNQEKIIGLIYYYVLLTGDTGFLAEFVDGKSVRDHVLLHAMYGDGLTQPPVLIDYGVSNSHLELRRGLPYNHIMPDLNGRRYANYLRAATLCDLSGHPAPFLRERAELLKPLLKERLWDAQAQWFRFEDGQGKADLRYTVQMFKVLGTGVLDPDCEQGILSHLNDQEFLSAYGLHSLSKRDPAYDQLDIDNGGGGICTSFPPQIIERLYKAGQPKFAADILGRLLWWADTMPYWGDSIAANSHDYRRDTPLQCTFDAVAAAQCIIFGVFGVSAQLGGEIVISPHALPFARRMTLKGLKLRGRSADVRVEGDHFEVRSNGQRIRSPIGKPVVWSTKDGKLKCQD